MDPLRYACYVTYVTLRIFMLTERDEETRACSVSLFLGDVKYIGNLFPLKNLIRR